MRNLAVDSSMLAPIGGAFYPTGHSMLMFETEDLAKEVGQRLLDHGFSRDEIYFVPANVVLAQITPTVSDADNPLPSAGTDGATVRAFTKLAREGHAGLLVRTEEDEARDRLMAAVGSTPYAIAQRYRRLVIEDL